MRARAFLAILTPALLLAAPATAAEKRPKPARKEADLNDPAVQLQLGQRLEARGDVAAALQLYQAALAARPNDEAALRAAANALMRMGFPAAAHDYLAALVRLRPNDAPARLALAAALNAREEPTAALEQLQAAEAAGAPPAPLWTQRGIAYDLSGDQAQAQQAYSRAINAAPGDFTIPLKLALSLAISTEYPAALQILQQWANNPAAVDQVRRTLAMVYALSGQTDFAVEIAQSVMAKDAAEAMRPFYARVAGLPPAQQALAGHFNRLPPVQAQAQAIIEQAPQQPITQPPITQPPITQPTLARPEPEQAGPEPAMPSHPRPEARSEPAPPAAAASATGQPPVVVTGIGKAVVVPAAPAGDPGAGGRRDDKGVAVSTGVDRQAPDQAPAASAEGAFWVQVASLPSRDGLAAEWTRVREAGGVAVAKWVPHVAEADVGGVRRYRLLLGPFASFQEAGGLLGDLSAKGLSGVVKKATVAPEPLHR
jgi:tetratricopeptide (TPR) repeat protein